MQGRCLWDWGREALAEEINRLLEKKQRRVLWGGGKGRASRRLDHVSGQPIVLGYQQGVVEIEIGPTPKLRDYKVDRCKDTHTQIGLIDEVGGAVTVAWRHRDHRPP